VVARYIIRGASSGLVPQCDLGRPDDIVSLWQQVASKKHGCCCFVRFKAGWPERRDVRREPQLKQSPQPTQFKELPCINPGHWLGKAEFIEWQEAIGHE
jgi:hypothetical protein